MARTSLEHSKVVLGAILPKRLDLLNKALIQLTVDHFPDPQYKALYMLMERYLETAGGVLTKNALIEQLSKRNVDAGKIALYETTYDVLAASEVDESDFKWSVEQLKELAAAQDTAQAITEGMEILNRGAKDSKGEDLFGHDDARKHILTKFAEIDRDLSMQESPEGDSRTEAEEIMQEYLSARTFGGIKFGIPELDDKLGGGLQNGELDLVVGYSSSGKTSLATIQLAWHAAIMQGKNVVICTSETLRPQVRRKLICRHSKLPQFGLDEGINSRDLKRGKGYLKPEEEAILPAILDDYTSDNPNYGKLVIVQIPRGATIGTVEGKLLRYQREFQVDLAIVDYLALLRSDRKRSSMREELSAIVQEAKQMATTFDDGRGIPVVSPWQVNRDSWKEAQKAGSYNSSALAETSEATSSSDVVISLLEPEGVDSRYTDLIMQVVKNRDGEKSNRIDVSVDYATSFFSTDRRSTGNSVGNFLLSPDTVFGGL